MLSAPVADAERDDLGRLLQSMLILWAYLDFMQLLIIWQSNLPKEVSLVHRPRPPACGASSAGLIAICHFLLPFLVLLIPAAAPVAPRHDRDHSLLILMSVAPRLVARAPRPGAPASVGSTSPRSWRLAAFPPA